MISSELIKTGFNFITYCFGLSGLFLTAKLFILDQIPNIPTEPGSATITIILASYLSLMLTALYKQGKSIENIENVLNKTLEKDNEKHVAILKQNEVIAEHLKNINDIEKEQIDLIRDSSGIKAKCEVEEAFDHIQDYKQVNKKRKISP